MNYRFDEFELDTGLFELRRNGGRVAMEPQVFTVLAYLVDQRHRVVTKHDLLDHVWGDRFISEAALTSRLMAARKALGDSGQEQRYIKTVHRRGYRFVGGITSSDEAAPSSIAPVSRAPGATDPTAPPLPDMVGREQELAHLRECFESARTGARTLVFVTGEPGLGKSTLIDGFIRALGPAAARIATGHCVEQRGVGEPYMPAIEALSRLVEQGDPAVLQTMMRRAPTWMLQAPWLLTDDDIAHLRERALGNTSERMLREAAEAIEELTTDIPLVLVLEDLHWADRATLDLINWIGRGKGAARLLLIGSYRQEPGDQDGILALQRELRVRGLCHDVALPMLTLAALQVHLDSRFPGLREGPELSRLLLQRTDGNPLFARAIVERWQATGALDESDGTWRLTSGVDALRSAVPESLRGLIADRISRVSPAERELLEVAAIASSPFSSAQVAAVLAQSVEQVELACEAMRGGGGMLRASDEPRAWPGSPYSGSYEFVHGLYEEVVYAAVLPARRSRLHQEMGEQIEHAAGDNAESFATELARHFRQSGDGARAIRYLRAVADQAMFRGAHREGAEHLRQALALLSGIADASLRTLYEAEMQSLLADATIATEGFGAPDAERAYKRAMELTGSVEDDVRRAGVVFGLAALLEYQAKAAEADVLLEQIDASGIDDRKIRVPYHALRSCSAFHRGMFSDAIDHGEEGLRLQLPGDENRAFAFLGQDPMLSCREWSSHALWFIGYPDSALRRMNELVELSAQLDRRYAYASALSKAARLHQMRLEAGDSLKRAEEAIIIAEEYGFTYHLASGKTVLGWSMVALGDAKAGLDVLREGLDLHKSTGVLMDRPYYLCLLADALHRSGEGEDARRAIDEALDLTARSGAPFFYEPELHRLRGAILYAAENDSATAEAAVRESIRIARVLQARSLELRASSTLAEILQGRGEGAAATAHLAGLLAGFTEGGQSTDQVRARQLLETVTEQPAGKKRNRPKR